MLVRGKLDQLFLSDAVVIGELIVIFMLAVVGLTFKSGLMRRQRLEACRSWLVMAESLDLVLLVPLSVHFSRRVILLLQLGGFGPFLERALAE